MKQNVWRLPDGIDEVLPPDAGALEQMRRRVLDLFGVWGYQYVEPPLIEFLDGLLVGSGNDLELQTFRMVDQRSGRMLGIRADMTSQAARIDAASMSGDAPRRLCYAGTVVHANPTGVLESRVPLLAGAELFGAPGVAADAEVISLMVETLRCAGIDEPVVELGHVGIFRCVAAVAEMNTQLEEAVFAALQRKAQPDLEELFAQAPVAPEIVAIVSVLPTLLGDRSILARARREFGGAPDGVLAALDELETLADAVMQRCAGVRLRFDLCELTGYGYHTGVVFAAYSANFGRAVARGGRYDGIGAAFGRGRAATGFDVDLKRLPKSGAVARAELIWAPGIEWVDATQRAALVQAVAELRQAGESVIGALASSAQPDANCDRELVWADNAWRIRPLQRHS